MSGANELSRDVDIDISGLFSELRRKLWLVIGLPLIVGAGLFVFFAGMDPSYKSSARIIIEKRESIFTRQAGGDVAVSGNQFDEQAVGSQVEVLASDDLALKVINRLNLIENPEFNAPPSFLGNLLSMAGSGTGSGASPQERVLNEFRSRLVVYAVEKSRVIAIEFWAHDRKLAQEIPNALADEYLAFTKQSQLQSTEDATGWLGPEIEELRAKVRESEAKVAEYRANSDILVGNNNALLSTQQLSEVSSELSRVRGDRSAAEGKIAAIRAALDKGGSLDVIPEVMASQLVQRLREREVSLQAQISELGTSLGPNHPRLKALKSQAGDFSGQIRNEAQN
ncbi:MAG TPA: GumC family protein, partial [Rhizobiaceae bacterium]|nr:GumC family protein [Rhizobiaceae bacterium]